MKEKEEKTEETVAEVNETTSSPKRHYDEELISIIKSKLLCVFRYIFKHSFQVLCINKKKLLIIGYLEYDTQNSALSRV